MKVLLVNKFHWNKGGSEKYYFELGELLKEHGHEVAYFSMEDEKNIKTGDKEYFVEKIDLNQGSKLKALDVIYSKNNYKKMIEAIEDFKPDIIHVNNFQRQLSASIIKAANDKKIPVVFTAHDVQAICPAITMMDNDKNVCELCTGGKYLNCIKKSCNKGSKAKSILGAIEGYYYRNHKIYSEKINKIITPSNFIRNKFIKDGINENHVVTLHNYVDTKEYDVPTKDEGYAFFFGRLSQEKGIVNLVKAFAKCKDGKLYIAGDGPEKEIIEKIIKDNKISGRVKLLGFLNKNEIINYISNCRFVVVPSTCNENCPYSVIESMAVGKPVVGTKNGGIPELIEDNKNGNIYECDDLNKLTSILEKYFEDDRLMEKYSKYSKKIAVKEFDKENYYYKLEKIYDNVINGVK